MFDKILIANRGEIAIRIMRTAQELGIATVAIYSSADKNSLHVQRADEAYWVGEAPSVESYLNIEAIIAAAVKSGAQAIHPGYGFLSENPLFAQACGDAGIVFIGPSIEALEAMGSKQLAKQRLEKTKVPLVPGYHGTEQSDDHLLQAAHSIGFPVLLKAANGGGGKGMRAVYKEADFLQALKSTRRESLAYFGDANIILEKLLSNPRHIEVQIMADTFGNIVHLFERDCSIQRRHQKIIEEAPAPHIDPALSNQLAEAAIIAARSINYRGAGTIEFLLDEKQNFYFMEMNTRLQVEHPVTEMITGLDLVAWQILIAEGKPLPLKQEEIKAEGHAIECRIYAEDAANDFLPSIGDIKLFKAPKGAGLRLDSGVADHAKVSQYYDPLLAKLISWGQTREEALLRMQRALREFAILGITTNIPFLISICHNKAFVTAKTNTHFLEKETIVLPTADRQLALRFALAYDYLKLLARTKDPLYLDCFAWSMHLKTDWTWRYLIEDKEESAQITAMDKEHCKAIIAEREYRLSAWMKGPKLILEDGKERFSAYFEAEDQDDTLLTIHLPSGSVRIQRIDAQTFLPTHNTEATQALTSPMPATIVALLKKPGDAIKKNEALMVLEAMKMEHTIRAPEDGVLKEFFYTTGDQVNEGVVLLSLD